MVDQFPQGKVIGRQELFLRSQPISPGENDFSIPDLLGVLFSGCGDPIPNRGGAPGATGPGGPAGAGERGAQQPSGFGGRPGGRPDGEGAKKAIYLTIAEKAFEAGYEPNVRCFPERFRKTFADEVSAVKWVAGLKRDFDERDVEWLSLNVAPFLAPVEDGVEFCIATRAAIIWWDVA